jgi:hypothetical protein
MPQRSQRFGLEMPDDFPLQTLEATYACVRDGHEWPERPVGEYSLAVNGILYRFRACTEFDDELRGSLTAHGGAPQIEERYRQERALFGFYSTGQSALECFFYGAWFLASLNDPTVFDPGIEQRKVSSKKVVKAFTSEFPKHQMTEALAAVNVSPELEAWRLARNQLTHAGQPGRTFSGASVVWRDEPLSAARTGDARQWLSQALAELLDAKQVFVKERF